MALLDELSNDLPEGVEWEERDLKIIALVEATLADIGRLEALIEREGDVVTGSTGQSRLNAAFTELRGQRLAAARMLASLKIPVEAPPTFKGGRRVG